jgi:hypothetical protein
MYRKLVKLNLQSGGYSEVDPIRLRRAALTLKAYLDKLDPAQDRYEIRDQVAPLVDAVLDGTASLPYDYDIFPLKYLNREGLLPREFTSLYASFTVTSTGSLLEKPNIVMVDGEQHIEMDFEEPGDWPEVVKKREQERREQLFNDPDL